MKLAKLFLFSMMCFSAGAQAITFCQNAKGPNNGVGGANWMLLPHDRCPANTSKVGGMQRFGYTLENVTDKSCTYVSPRTKARGDKLICETKLTRSEAAVKIRKSGITSSGLQRHADRYETPVEELEAHEDAAPAPAVDGGGSSAPDAPAVLR